MTHKTCIRFLPILAAAAILLPASLTAALDQGASGARCSPDIANRAKAIYRETVALVGTGQPKALHGRFIEAFTLWLEAGDAEEAAHAAIEIGSLFEREIQYQQALDCYRQAFGVKLLSRRLKAVACNSIARVYSALYHRDLALHYYEKALGEARRARDASAQRQALAGLAALLYRLGDRQEAARYVGQAKELAPPASDEKLEAELLFLSGQIDLDFGRVDPAREAFERVLASSRKTGDVAGEIQALSSISDLYTRCGQSRSALVEAERAVGLAESQGRAAATGGQRLSAWQLSWRAWLVRAKAERATGQKEAAIKSLKRAILYVEGLWTQVFISTESAALAFREERQAPYRELVDLLVEQGEIVEARKWAEITRAKVLLSLINAHLMSEARLNAGRQTPGGAEDVAGLRAKLQSPELRADERRRLKRQLLYASVTKEMEELKTGLSPFEIPPVLSKNVSALRTALLVAPSAARDRVRLETELKEAEVALDEARVMAEMEWMRLRLFPFETVPVKELEEKLAPGKEAVLEFSLGEDRSFAWLISSAGVEAVTLAGRGEIEQAAARFMQSLGSPPGGLYIERDLRLARDRGEQLASLLLGDLKGKIAPYRNLIIVPDGALHHLPFEALVVDGRYLVEDHRITYLPSASAGALLEERDAGAESSTRGELLAFGDPDFTPASQAPVGDRRARSRESAVYAGQAPGGYGLPPLPMTRDEVNSIAGLFPPEATRVFLGRNASEDALKREPLRRYRRIHFATHSLVNEKSPKRSAVVLALDSDPAEDGLLDVAEIARLGLEADLVVLSACRTGRGQLVAGEGIVGLGRAFLFAGARSIVVSLWDVSDTSASRFMKSFYRLLAGGSGPADALRGAKMEVLGGKKQMRHPYYWAPFIVTGAP